MNAKRELLKKLFTSEKFKNRMNKESERTPEATQPMTGRERKN